MLELLPGLLLGVLPLSHTPGHICGKTTGEQLQAGGDNNRQPSKRQVQVVEGVDHWAERGCPTQQVPPSVPTRAGKSMARSLHFIEGKWRLEIASEGFCGEWGSLARVVVISVALSLLSKSSLVEKSSGLEFALGLWL